MPRITRPALEPTCPACGSTNVRVVQRREPLLEPDVQGEFLFEITECAGCREVILSMEQAEAHERSYAAAVARLRNDMTADRIYELRIRLGMSQAQMEEAFGLGPKTWGRWERGEIAPSGPAARLMWLAENRADAFWQLKDAHTPRERHVKISGAIQPQGPGMAGVGFRIAKPAHAREDIRGGNGSGDDGGAV